MSNEREVETVIPARVKYWAMRYPDRGVFISYSDSAVRTLTCKEVYTLSGKFAALLQRRGLKPKDVVCNTLTNSIERLITDFGIFTAGCISANANALLTDGTDLLNTVNVSECRLLIADDKKAQGEWDLLKGHLGDVQDKKVKSSNAPKLEMVEFVNLSLNNQFIESLSSESEPAEVDISPSDIAVFWATSGSTGFSKMVPHSHQSICLMSKIKMQLFEIGEGDKFYSDRPLGWAGGWPYDYLHSAVPLVMTDTGGQISNPAQHTWKTIVKERCTHALLTVSVMKAILHQEAIWKATGYKLRLAVFAGQPFQVHCSEFLGTLAETISSSYGLTECGYATSMICEKEEDVQDFLVGRPKGPLEMKVVDDKYVEVATGKMGQILVRGPHVSKGYLNNHSATTSAFTEDGWLKTDDLGFSDQKGCVFIEGRRSDAISHGEYLIYPCWVEKKLRTCPYIDDVMVVPIPDECMYHQICACVIKKDDKQVKDDVIQQYCDQMFVSDDLHEMSAKPSFYLFIESFPLRPTGKPDRRSLAELAVKYVKSKNL